MKAGPFPREVSSSRGGCLPYLMDRSDVTCPPVLREAGKLSNTFSYLYTGGRQGKRRLGLCVECANLQYLPQGVTVK